MLHGMVGMMLIPLLALVLLIISFFAKIPGGVKWAAIVLGLVVLQVALGIFGHETPYVGSAARPERAGPVHRGAGGRPQGRDVTGGRRESA